GRRVIYLPGLDTPRVLQAVLSVLPIDTFVPDPCATMQGVGEPDAGPPVVVGMNIALAKARARRAVSLQRHSFYAPGEGPYAVVETGERRFNGTIPLPRGVVPREAGP